MVRIYNFIHEHDMLPYGTILICDNFPSAAKQSIRSKYLIKELLNKSEVLEESENFNFLLTLIMIMRIACGVLELWQFLDQSIKS